MRKRRRQNGRKKNNGFSRRAFLKCCGVAGLALCLPLKWGTRTVYAQIPGGTLDPGSVNKYVSPLVKPPKFPFLKRTKNTMARNGYYYELAMRQFAQQILPAGLPTTTVWSYGPADDTKTVAQGGRNFYPAFTLENKWKQPTTVKWINSLVDGNGDPLPHLLPVDPSLHWANPIGRRDTRPNPSADPTYWNHTYIGDDGRYIGPVPMVTHVHGAHTHQQSDGYPEAWWLPAGALGVNHTNGTYFDIFNPGDDLFGDGFATFTYPNDQRATTLWYHDHSLGMTRLNVYAGPAGFYLLRGGPDDDVRDSRDGTQAVLPGPAPGVGINPFGTFYEIPIVIQDRSFNAEDGSLFFPDNRAFFEGLDPSQLRIPFTYDQLGINPNANGWGLGCDDEVSDVAPIWNPEFFGNMMVVNGQTWPYLDVEQRRYRFRLLNGCNSRFLVLQFNDPRVKVWQIGSEGGFLPAPVLLNDFPPDGNNDGTAKLLIALAERADVIVDFTDVPSGTEVLMLNIGPDEPFGGFPVIPSDPASTGQVMQFRVGPAMSVDTTTPPQYLQLPAISALVPGSTRQVSLNEEMSKNIFVSESDGSIIYDCAGEPFGPTAALCGTYASGNPTPKLWMDAVTENPSDGSTEEWEIYNFTADAHPIHVHLVQFQVVNRQALDNLDEEGIAVAPAFPTGTPRNPEAWETGFKDTVISYPGEVTRIKAKFDIPGLFVWHCHIVDHEDNEMMRPYRVV